MPLNKATGNMYPFVTHTWNTVKGACPHDCSYCYMKRWGELKPAHFDQKELNVNLGTGNYIFIGSSCDMFAKNIPNEWIGMTLVTAGQYPNKYLLQTKNPERFQYFLDVLKPEKFTLCTTIETNWYFPGISEHAPRFFNRAEAMEKLYKSGFKTMVTIEPIMDFEVHAMTELIKQAHPYQVNIGADTGRNGLPEPPKRKIIELIAELKTVTTVVEKNNLRRLVND